MSATLQAKLLRVLQEREVDRVGGKQPVPVDVRVIATTNRDLKKEMSEGRFREDLYYRLSAFPIKLLPLRERPEDILLLSEHFTKKFAVQLNKTITGFTAEAIEMLTTRYWKGNIRELENAIHRAVLISRTDLIGAEDFLIDGNPVQCHPNNGSLKVMEMDMILKTLEVIKETKRSIGRKKPESLEIAEQEIQKSNIKILQDPSYKEIQANLYLMDDPDDVPILLAANKAKVDYLAKHDHKHFLDDPIVAERARIKIGTPGDVLTWLRENL